MNSLPLFLVAFSYETWKTGGVTASRRACRKALRALGGNKAATLGETGGDRFIGLAEVGVPYIFFNIGPISW